MDRRLVVITLILFVNVLGNGLILPLLPFFAENLGATPLMVGLFIAAYPFFSILAGPPLGAISDRYGRRPVLIFSIIGTIIGFFLLGVAATLPLLFLARIIDGASAGNMSTAKAAIADITTPEERVTKMGFTFAAESLGLILGPLIGGLFSQYGFTVSANIAAGIALVCLLLTIFIFPETKPPRLAAAPRTKIELFRPNDGLDVLRSSQMRSLIMIVFIVQLLIMMMWGTLALYTKALFGFSGKEIGYISAFAALVGISAQTGLLRLLTRLVQEKFIVILALSAMVVGLSLIAFSSDVALLLVGVGLMAASFNTAMPTVVGLTSKRASDGTQGQVMGTISSAISLATMLGPVLANAVFTYSMSGSYLFGAALGVCALILSLKQDINNPQRFSLPG